MQANKQNIVNENVDALDLFPLVCRNEGLACLVAVRQALKPRLRAFPE